MITFRLPERAEAYYSEEPETGMGYQQVQHVPIELRNFGQRGFILDASFLLLVDTERDFTLGQTEGLNRSVPLYRDIESLLADTKITDPEIPFEPFGLELPGVLSWMPPVGSAPPPTVGGSGVPPFMHFTQAGEEFFRMSAYHGDRRIALNGSVAPGTYATTPNDLTVTPSGLAAVGRFALPVRIPACYVFQIIPLPGTPIYFGTVIPNFGFCGGGVEVYFPYGCAPGCARISKTIPLY